MTAITDGRPRTSSGFRDARSGGLAGMVAGPLFLLVVVVLTFVERDHMQALGWRFTSGDEVPYPSGLALGDFGFVLVAAFALTGALVLTFATALSAAWGDRRSGRVAVVLIGLIGVALLLAAFPTDRASVTGTPNTWHGLVHGVGFVLLMLLSLTAPVAAGVAIRHREGWSDLARLMFAVPVVSILLLLIEPAIGDAAFLTYIAVLFGWMALLAHRLRTPPAQSARR